ncbi:MAG TPA: putative toxin-antitoxin system toxin component, PIN family [Ardenticatenaceae bacterium]|jgi:hypothetical protein
MRVVIDTNVVISRFLSASGPPAQLFAQWESRAFELLVSEPILAEYARVLRYQLLRVRHKMSDEEIDEVIDEFKSLGMLIEIEEVIEAVEDDPDDNKFIECAITGKADYIISGDTHLFF